MVNLHLLLFFLVVTYSVASSNVPSYPDALYPKDLNFTQLRLKCPVQLGRIQFCAAQYEECFGHSRTEKYCGNQFCVCSNGDDQSNNQECKQYLDQACFAVHNTGHKFQREIIEKREKSAVESVRKRLKSVISSYDRMVEDCGVESKLKMETEVMMKKLTSTNALHHLVMPFFAMVNTEPLMNKTEKCLRSIDEFQAALEEADSKASDNLKQPYVLWYTGIEFGPIGKVISRIGIDELCGKASFELNQESAAHLDCYDGQAGRQECDEKYINNINYLLTTMDSKKLVCKMMVELMKSIKDLRGEEFYREAREFHPNAYTTSIRGRFSSGFSGFENGSMTRRETKTTFVNLEASQKSSFRIKDRFEKVSSKCGGSKNSADTVASCGLRYEHCVFFNEQECPKQLSICLSSIDDGNKECQKEIDQFKELLWPETRRIKYSQERDFGIEHAIALILTGIVFVVVGYILCQYRSEIKERICRRIEQNENHEEIPLDPTLQRNAAPQEENEGSLLNPPNSSDMENGYANNNDNVHVIEKDVGNNEPREQDMDMKYDVISINEINNDPVKEIQKDPSQPSTSS
ncbi:unnamed protein product [Caenorhabditis brenneri]